MTAPVPAPSPEAPHLRSLFLLCFKVGILSFGGGLSGWLYREFVLRKRWIDEEDFSSSLAISQMLPGANVVNLVICMGEQLRGPVGALTCVLGFLVGPFFAVVGLCQLFDALSGYPLLPVISDGVAFAAMGLLIIMCIHGVRRAMQFPPSVITIAVTAVLVGVFRLPLIPVVCVIAPVSVALAWRRI
ncbi:chromate transporter [Phyllobacterium endophyticum]|uniref:chromate transporter n=1 Tax=Phyllobacterium endophyticum TaxID=1149773 RepID=UPI00164EEDF2|nr:chromate transporter [Phyllobacterium endophyticum]